MRSGIQIYSWQRFLRGTVATALTTITFLVVPFGTSAVQAAVDPRDPIVGQWVTSSAVVTDEEEVTAEGNIIKLTPPTKGPCPYSVGEVLGTGVTRNSDSTYSLTEIQKGPVPVCAPVPVPSQLRLLDANHAVQTGTENGIPYTDNWVRKDRQPIGIVDGCDGRRCWGWARDPDFQGSIFVHLYVDGKFAAEVKADAASEPAVGGIGFHRWSWQHNRPRIDRNRKVDVYGINVNFRGDRVDNNIELSSSPKEIPAVPECTSNSVVYRGDTRSPDVIFSQGFQHVGTEEDLLVHLFDGGSAYVSTSKVEQVAASYAYTGNWLYAIQKPGLTVGCVLGGDYLVPEQQEVVFDNVEPQKIISARLVQGFNNGVWELSNTLNNPGYQP